MLLCTVQSDFFKVRLSPFRKIGFTYLNKTPLRVMKNALYFMLKAANPFKTDKTAGVETTSKVSLELTTRMNLGRRGARKALNLRHSPQAPSQS